MTEIKIHRIEIREVNIPKIPVWELYVPTLDVIYKPKVDIPGCVRVHRNNLPSLIDNDKDEYGTYSECGNFIIPSFEPLQYNPNEFTYTESKTPNKQEQEFVETKDQSGQYIPPKDKKDVFVECPGKKDQKIGDYRNEKRISRVSGHKRSEDGTECITLYEDVTFIDSVLPSPSAALNVVTISLIAASSPLLIPAIKSLSKTAFKKILAKFDKKKTDKEKR
tara:strand:- start:1909 stop:2571 length:663 start_codon:yes stop_codon:yes gene_type:complete